MEIILKVLFGILLILFRIIIFIPWLMFNIAVIIRTLILQIINYFIFGGELLTYNKYLNRTAVIDVLLGILSTNIKNRKEDLILFLKELTENEDEYLDTVGHSYESIVNYYLTKIKSNEKTTT